MKIHCIGIGGIGLSALARYYRSKGYEVSGSDMNSSDLTSSLQKEGITFYQGHDGSHITKEVTKVIYSIAVQETNPEYVEAKRRGLEMKTYPEALGEVTKEKVTIAICGTHGKTTTTAMVYYAMKACGVHPTVIVGSLLAEGGTNFVAGESQYLIVEACEYKRSFLNLYPQHIIITNIDADHLDYYRDIDDIKNAFQVFSEKLKQGGVLTTHSDVSIRTEGVHIDADRIEKNTIELTIPGEHNRENAQLVIACLTHLGFSEEKVREGLKHFPGTWRRMEYKGKTVAGIPVYDDYGHHPKEIKASVQALRERYSDKKIIMFFQPHLYSRTKVLFDDFVRVLQDIEMVYILPIYRARQEDTTVTSEASLVDAINVHGGNARAISFENIKEIVEKSSDPSYVMINMGAGNAFEEFNRLSLVS